MIQHAEEEENRADEDDNLAARDISSKHKAYLTRHLKQQKISSRAKTIATDLSLKFPSPSREDNPEVFHASASNYMDWIKKSTLRFNEQPALTPDMTGVPAIRKFLYSLPTQNNLRDYTLHLTVSLPAFIDKVKRATDLERDEGFRELAEEFDTIRDRFISDLRMQAKVAFEAISENGIKKIRLDVDAFKQQLETKLEKEWLTLPAPAFKKIISSNGVVHKGASKAKGLQNGCNWNQEIADIISPGFDKWQTFHSRHMKDMELALHSAFGYAHQQIVNAMDTSSANLVVVEKAKKKWHAIRPKMEIKLSLLMQKIEKLEKRTNLWATMRDGRDNNLIARTMKPIYDAVFEAEPATKQITIGKNKGKTRFVSPKTAFQKDSMWKLAIDADTHLVDDLIITFQGSFDASLNNILGELFGDIGTLLESFSASLRRQAPINYKPNPTGKQMRESLEELIPTLVKKAEELKAQLPVPIKQEDYGTVPAHDISIEETNETVSERFDRIRKRKRSGEVNTPRMRIKTEH